jgi:hypothetical protein
MYCADPARLPRSGTVVLSSPRRSRSPVVFDPGKSNPTLQEAAFSEAKTITK